MMILRPLLFLLSLSGFSLHAHACSVAQPEEFPAFFSRFSSSKEFALSRTLYPSPRVRYDYRVEDGKQEITETRRKASRQEDLKYLPLKEHVSAFGLKLAPPEVSQKTAVAHVSSDAWQMSYHFALSQGCWFLQEIQQHVM